MNSFLSHHIATSKDRDELIRLWKLCFTEDTAFLHFFFDKGFPLTQTHVLRSDQAICAALSFFPISYCENNLLYPGSYLYGVCTHPEHQGKGYSRKLFQQALTLRKKSGDQFILTRPASHDLFSFYIDQGFNCPLYQQEDILQASQQRFPVEPHPNTWTKMTPESLGKWQAQASEAAIHWSADLLNYIMDYYKRDGGLFLEREDEYAICIPNPEHPDEIHILDGKIRDFADIQTLFPKQKIHIHSTASAQNGKLYALVYPITKELKPNCSFPFPME